MADHEDLERAVDIAHELGKTSASEATKDMTPLQLWMSILAERRNATSWESRVPALARLIRWRIEDMEAILTTKLTATFGPGAE